MCVWGGSSHRWTVTFFEVFISKRFYVVDFWNVAKFKNTSQTYSRMTLFLTDVSLAKMPADSTFVAFTRQFHRNFHTFVPATFSPLNV